MSGFAYEVTYGVPIPVASYIDRLHGRLERLGFASVDAIAETARLKSDLAAVRRERDRLGAERDEAQKHIDIVRWLRERTTRERDEARADRDQFRDRNQALVAQRDAAYARLVEFGRVLSDATFALKGSGL